MKPLTAEAHCLFSRLIVKAAGQLVENIELMNVQEEYVRRILPLEKRKICQICFWAQQEETTAMTWRPNRWPEDIAARFCLGQ